MVLVFEARHSADWLHIYPCFPKVQRRPAPRFVRLGLRYLETRTEHIPPHPCFTVIGKELFVIKKLNTNDLSLSQLGWVTLLD